MTKNNAEDRPVERPLTNRENREIEKKLRRVLPSQRTGWQKYWGFMGWWAGTFWLLLGIGAVLALLPVIAGLFS